jgi:hypothetical protein
LFQTETPFSIAENSEGEGEESCNTTTRTAILTEMVNVYEENRTGIGLKAKVILFENSALFSVIVGLVRILLWL